MVLSLTLMVFVSGLPRPLEPIPITIEPSQTVGHLKEAIFPKIAQSVKHKIDAAALSLYKVDFPDLHDVNDLNQSALKAKKEKLLASLRLSSVFTASPPDLSVSILAEVPPFDDEPSQNGPRLAVSNVSNNLTADLDSIWKIFWGNLSSPYIVERSVHIPDERTLKAADYETKYKFLTLPDAGVFPCGLSRVLITNTYGLLYDKLCEEEKLHGETPCAQRFMSLSHSTIITGQPATGKTAGLSCILAWRLQHKKPTVYCDHKLYAHVFTQDGVTRVTLDSLHYEKRIETLDQCVDCCALIDINTNLTVVPSQFHPNIRLGRVVVASSPDPNHVKAFKQCNAKTLYTPTWKWPDLYCASLLLKQPTIDPPAVQKPTVERLRDIFTKLRGIPRRCFRALASSSSEKYEMDAIKTTINRIHDFKAFAQSANGPLPFKDDESHTLIRIEPSDDTWTTSVAELLSDYVAGSVYERIRLHNTMQIRESIDYLLRIPAARGWGGKLFERAVHRRFREGIEFQPEAIDRNAPALEVLIKKANSEADGYFYTLSVRAKSGSRDVHLQFLQQYLIPLSSTAETIDAVCISGAVTVLFQMTVSPVHDLNLKGITELTKELPHNAKKRVCIVFVVPDSEKTTEALYNRQKIIPPIGVSEDDPEFLTVQAYHQYVHYFPSDLF